METPLLAAALIVKNEEANLPGCLEALASLGPLLSDICVYDTGSTDRTVEIAHAAGAIVEEGFWDDDFSRARNAAIAMTRAKWVLIVDADERVRANLPRLRVELRAALAKDATGLDALRVSVADVRPGHGVIQTWPSRRLLRANRAHYRNRVHEDVYALRAGQTLREGVLQRTVLEIEHLGYTDAETLQQKMVRNEALADGYLSSHEADSTDFEYVRALVDRARSRQGDGRFEEALADFRELVTVRHASDYRAWGLEMFADLLVDKRLLDEAETVILRLRREGLSRPDYCDWLLARVHFARGRIKEGIELVRNIDHLVPANGGTASPYLLLQARRDAAIALGEYDEAAVCIIRLMAGQGRIDTRCGEVLLKCWGELPQTVLVEMLIEADQGHLDAVIAEFDRFTDGRPVAAGLRAALRAKETANL